MGLTTREARVKLVINHAMVYTYFEMKVNEIKQVCWYLVDGVLANLYSNLARISNIKSKRIRQLCTFLAKETYSNREAVYSALLNQLRSLNLKAFNLTMKDAKSIN